MCLADCFAHATTTQFFFGGEGLIQKGWQLDGAKLLWQFCRQPCPQQKKVSATLYWDQSDQGTQGGDLLYWGWQQLTPRVPHYVCNHARNNWKCGENTKRGIEGWRKKKSEREGEIVMGCEEHRRKQRLAKASRTPICVGLIKGTTWGIPSTAGPCHSLCRLNYMLGAGNNIWSAPPHTS